MSDRHKSDKATSQRDMTPHQRFQACMRFEDIDRVPLWEWGPWGSTLRRWQREGLGAGNAPPQLAECEAKVHCGVDLWMLPRYEEEILSRDELFITERTDRGVVQRRPASPDEMSMPAHLEFPVRGRGDWEKLKPRFDPADPGRFPPDWSACCDMWRADGPVVLFQGPRSPSLFGFVRELMGPERTLYACVDDPLLIHDMMETYTEFVLGVLPGVLDTATVSTLFFWEDMCYRSGPLISPAMFREFMLPRYRRITDLARSHGCDIIFVDSDGDVSQLIPLWLEAGLNGVYPMEVAAGMDVGALRREYGRDLLMTGGIDKRTLAQSREAIDAELGLRMPVADTGGYVPHLDHAIPHDVPYEAFCYYWDRKKDYLGWS